MITKDQYSILKQYENILSKAFHSASVTGTEMKIINELSELYVTLGNRKPNLRCGACVIGFLSTLYKEVMLYEKELNNKKKTKTKAQSK